MQDSRDRFTASVASQSLKRLGGYLVEAGLLTPAQVDVALNDQKIMDGMRFGEVLSARGWVKQQTVEYFMKKIVEPERRAVEQARRHQLATDQDTLSRSADSRSQPANSTSRARIQTTNPGQPSTSSVSTSSNGGNERKSLPSVGTDDDVSWVG